MKAQVGNYIWRTITHRVGNDRFTSPISDNDSLIQYPLLRQTAEFSAAFLIHRHDKHGHASVIVHIGMWRIRSRNGCTSLVDYVSRVADDDCQSPF